jgi:sterol desaturase/sphingolipid hydroxylase (fatty acid hydroxylase superfamily)
MVAELLHRRLGGLEPLAACVLAALLCLLLARRFLPGLRGSAPEARASRWQSLRTDLGYLALSPLVEALSRVVTTFAMVCCVVLAGGRAAPDLLGGFGPVVDQPRWLVVLEMLFIGDFFYYWAHRMAHTLPQLWRIHAVHHSSRHLRWTSALRVHPAETYVQLCHQLPLFLVGFPIDALIELAPIMTLYGLLIHSDSNLCLRPVSYLFNSPGFHRWHHAREVRGSGTNFAGLFPFYDALFGTYDLPAAPPPAVGIDDPHMPSGCVEQLLHPFRPAPDAARGGSAPERPVRARRESGDRLRAARRPRPWRAASP